MTWRLGPDERLTAPEEFQEKLTEIGGLNPYDEPNFIVQWGQTATHRTAGWNEYKDTLLMFNDASWGLFEWRPPSHFGTPESWYATNFDEASGLSLLGEYPYEGKYVLLFNLSYRYMENSELKVFRFPLCDMLLDHIVPLVMDAQDTTVERNKAAWEAQQEEKEENVNLMIEGIRRNKKLAFKGGSISYAGQGVRTSVIDQRVLSLSAGWQEAAKRLKNAGVGFHQGEL